MINNRDVTLYQHGETKTRYKYVSKHELPQDDFQFEFMKGRTSEHFPDQNVKVIQAGGYTPIKIEWKNGAEDGDVKIMAFISHDEMGISFYEQLPYRHINIYEAFYENCAYAYILEIFVEESYTDELILQMKKYASKGTEFSVYTECLLTSA